MNCLNGERYLEQSIKSLLSQEYKNWELIFIDNNSNDNSSEIYRKFKDNRFKYFFLKKKVSLYKARNLALSKASGEYISFLDVDDFWDKKKLKIQVKELNNTNKNILYSNYYILKDKNKQIAFKQKMPEGFIHTQLSEKNFVPILTVIFRKKILSKYNFKFNNKYNIIGDFDLFFKMSKVIKFNYTNKALATYRIHKNNFSILNNKMYLKEYKAWLKKNQNTISNDEFNNFSKLINFMKIKILIFDSRYKLAIYELLKFPMSKNKLKLFLYLFLPKKLFSF